MVKPAARRIERDSLLAILSQEWVVILAITTLAAALRFYGLAQFPPGLYRDEAYNGIDALGILRGARPLYLEANNGREPLFIYLIALSISFLGRSPFAIRAVSALLGTLTIPAAYAMTRAWFGRREAILTALITATTFWHVNLSRIGFRVVSLPLLAALCLWALAHGVRRQSSLWMALAGILLGITLYTYIAARFVPVAIVLFLLFWRWRRSSLKYSHVALSSSIALVVALPLLLYFARQGAAFWQRSSQVSVLNPAINHGDLLGTLARHVARTAAMFNWRGDFIPRHNLPSRPVFDLSMGMFFLAGIWVALRRASRSPQYALPLIYCAVLLLPTILAEGAPHFLRAAGVLPVLLVLPAIGLSAACDMLRRRSSRGVAATLVAGVLLIGATITVRDYARHCQSAELYFNLESGATELAEQINRYTGVGWPAPVVVDGPPNTVQAKHVYLDKRLPDNWPSLDYLVPDSPSVEIVEGTGRRGGDIAQAQLLVWPHSNLEAYLPLLPPDSVISVQEGAYERGDLEDESQLLYVTYEANSKETAPRNLGARWEQGIELWGYTIQSDDDGTALLLYWQANQALDTNYSVFVHLARNGQIVAQSDSYPAQGYYPTDVWRAGDVIQDRHHLTEVLSPGQEYQIAVGLYSLETMQRLATVDASGSVTGDHVTIHLR